jgi:hypothetical protein
MGIFADTCQALVDPQTGKALTGDRLIEAQADPKSPRCGNRVKKSARFCNKCGRGAPGGWWKCPTCGKWVGNEAHFCWNCNTPLQPERRAGMSGGRWRNRPELFAERFEVGDIKRLLTDGLIVSEGTVALLLDSGAYKDALEPGSHNLDSLARRINHWGSPPPRTVVLVEAGEVVLPLRIEGLRSAEELEVRFYGEAILRFDPARGREFLANFLKDQAELRLQDIAERLTAEVRYAVENFCVASTIEDIVKDPERRLRLEDELKATLTRTTASWGIVLERVSSAEFYGRAYEELRAQAGEVEAKRRELEFAQRLRELLAGERMNELKSESDLEEYVAALAHERGISDARRDHELARLRQVHRHEIEAAEALHQMDQERDRAEHEIGLRRAEDAYSREKLKEDTAARIEAASAALDLKAKRKALKREDLEATAEILQGRDIQTLISLVDDPDKRAQLLEIHKRSSLQGLDTEKILALTASDSPQLAEALVEIARSRNEDRAQALSEREKLSKEHAAQLERILTKTLESVAEATRRPGANTIVNK